MVEGAGSRLAAAGGVEPTGRIGYIATHRITWILASLILATSGCGGDSSGGGGTPGPATPQKSTCSIFTLAEVEAAMGLKMDAGKESKSGGAQRCDYSGTEKTLATFWVGVYRGSTVEEAKTAYSFVGSKESHPIAGLGDEAKAESGAFGGLIVVRRGKIQVNVSVGSPVPPTEALLRDLVTKVLERI